MTDHALALALAEARLLHAACAYVDAEQGDPDLENGLLYQVLEEARAEYQEALRGMPADEELVRRGMRVVRRLLEEGAS